MAVNVVVVDGGRLPAGVEFPALQAQRYGWEQYPELAPEEIPAHCWRANVLITLGTPIGKPIIDHLARLQLIVVAGEGSGLADLTAARARGILVCNTPEHGWENEGRARALTEEIAVIVDAYLRGEERNRIS